MDDLLSIGQFAAASWLSQRALRLYDENGLLPPARIDPDSGYRYYRPDQLRDATLIRLLRRGGMPLAEIRLFLADPSEERLAEHERRLAGELADRRRVLQHLRRLLKEETMFEVQTKELGPVRYVGRTARMRVQELDRFIEETARELRGTHEAAGDDFVVYHGAVNEDEDGPVEVGLPTLEGEKTLGPFEVAFTVAVGPQTEFPEILSAYEAVSGWMRSNGREPAGPPFEINRRHAGEEPRIEIAWPLRPR
jgi:DNA-binding transcriptional MerR regulator